MESFEKLYQTFTTEDDRISTTDTVKIDSYFKEDSKVLLRDYIIEGRLLLSEYIGNLKVATKQIPIVSIPSIRPGLIGIYRHAYPKTETNDYGYLEEMRVLLNISLYADYLMLYLCPIISIEEKDSISIATYVPTNVVKLILYRNETPQQWIKLERDYNLRRGCSFDVSSILVGRTFVKDGQIIERDGRMLNRSAGLIVPQRFISLFEEALNYELIIW